MSLWIVFDSHESGRFVEVENNAGRSVGPDTTHADWKQCADGFWRLGPFAPDTEDKTGGWTRVEDDMPDADLIVLIHIPDGDDHSEPVWVGYYDEGEWRSVEGMPVTVTHWRELPAPPPEK